MNHERALHDISIMTFGIVIFPQVEGLDFIGPRAMITMWKQVAGGPPSCLIVAERKEPVVCAKGLSINPHVSLDECPTLDFLPVPGSQGTRTEVANQRMLAFIAAQVRFCSAILSVCTGSFVLHAARLLSGKEQQRTGTHLIAYAHSEMWR